MSVYRTLGRRTDYTLSRFVTFKLKIKLFCDCIRDTCMGFAEQSPRLDSDEVIVYSTGVAYIIFVFYLNSKGWL